MHSIYPWQQQQWQYLLARIDNANLPHALLFSGPQGLGKFDFAQALAELLLCKYPQANACGKCHACNLLQADNHPDFHLLQPEMIGKKIKVEQIRGIVNIVNSKAHQGGYQVIIINPADAMNISASNALLKTLEEPSGPVVIILITENPNQLPATIRSRCQQVVFHRPNQEVANQRLAARLADRQGLDLLLNLAEYAPLKVLDFIGSNNAEQREQLFVAFSELISNKLSAVKFAVLKTKLELPEILSYLQSWLMDMIKIKFSSQTKILINCDKLELLQLLAGQFMAAKLFIILDYLTEQYKYLANNLNKQLVLEGIGFKLQNSKVHYAS